MKKLSYILMLLIAVSLSAGSLPAQAQDWSQCPEADSRIAVGDIVAVSDADNLPLALRIAPRRSSRLLASIPIRTELEVIDGPRCSDGWGWWKVQYGRHTGWVAEVGPEGLYNLVPTEDSGSCLIVEHDLEVGDRGRVTPGLSNRIRRAASLESQQIGTARPGIIFRVLDGPICQDGYWWWKISYPSPNGTGRLIGWTVEGEENETGYEMWLEPAS